MYVIFLNQLESVEHILDALRSSGRVGDADLADGIDKNLKMIDAAGNLVAAPYSAPISNKPKLGVVQ